MPATQHKPPYSVFAEYYDQIAGPLCGPVRVAREQILLPRLRKAAKQRQRGATPLTACDLCCGTGTTAIEFARLLNAQKRDGEIRRGGPLQLPGGPLQPSEIKNQTQVFAVDRSAEMLRAARKNFRRAGARVETIRADMRTFRLPRGRRADVITCEFDAINHLAKKRELAAVARAVARALAPGGWFLFDANTRRAFETLWTTNWVVEGRGFLLAARGGYDRRRDKGWLTFDWFVAGTKRARSWRRYTERYEEVAWTAAEIRRALAAAGLRVVGAWDLIKFARGEPWARPGCRVFWLAQRR